MSEDDKELTAGVGKMIICNLFLRENHILKTLWAQLVFLKTSSDMLKEREGNI